MSKVDGTRLARPVGHFPNAQWSDAIATLGESTSSRTVSTECAVFASAVSYERNDAFPSRVSVYDPASGRFRSEYSTRIVPTMELPSGWYAAGRFAARLTCVWRTSPSHPASTIV